MKNPSQQSRDEQRHCSISFIILSQRLYHENCAYTPCLAHSTNNFFLPIYSIEIPKKKEIMAAQQQPKKTFIVEHLDPELEQWSALEYKCIAEESEASGAAFFLTSVPKELQLPEQLKQVSALQIEHRGIEEIYADRKDRVCLLDPSAKKELSPEDGETFDIFLFGGILGDDPPRGEFCSFDCCLSPCVTLRVCGFVGVLELTRSNRSNFGVEKEGVRG